MLLYLPQPRSAIIQQSRQDHTDGSFSIGNRRRTKHHIDARPLQVFSWPMLKLDSVAMQNQMVIRRCNVDTSMFD
jgi:hypothetical protein